MCNCVRSCCPRTGLAWSSPRAPLHDTLQAPPLTPTDTWQSDTARRCLFNQKSLQRVKRRVPISTPQRCAKLTQGDTATGKNRGQHSSDPGQVSIRLNANPTLVIIYPLLPFALCEGAATHRPHGCFLSATHRGRHRDRGELTYCEVLVHVCTKGERVSTWIGHVI